MKTSVCLQLLIQNPPSLDRRSSRKRYRRHTSGLMRTNRGFGVDPPEQKQDSVALAIVHHANQNIISDGYTNRPGIQWVVGSASAKRGLAYILELHRTYKIPANIHLSGTQLEALAWYQPQCLTLLKKMYHEDLVEIVGSAYGQNIMRFFQHGYNVNQLNEELDLFQTHLGVEPRHIKSFWPPERVWDTPLMAPAIRDSTLRNGGFDYVFIDDRLLLPVSGDHAPRHLYDRNPVWDQQLFHAYHILGGHGLIALPIAANLRRCIPPRAPEQQRSVENQLRWLLSLDSPSLRADFLAIYADDMEKPAAIGWDPSGPSQFERFLRWLSQANWVNPVKVSDWAATARIGETKNIEGGTYMELAVQFDAGELYEKWHSDSRWDPYRDYFAWAESRCHHLSSLGADPGLMELAEKHLLASSWETAWHTPTQGAHGNIESDGGPSGSSRAVASHSRHAAMIAEAAYWQTHKDDKSHCSRWDIDNDGEQELVFQNRELFAVVSPKGGGRLVALFSVADSNGSMVIGNPCDDWNFKEELNDYMDSPPNHPGALADVGFEHDSYEVEIVDGNGDGVRALLVNHQSTSPAFGLVKEISLSSYGDYTMRVEYRLPENLSGLDVEFGLSPDYLQLLRKGCSILTPHERNGARGWGTDSVAVWVKPAHCIVCRWAKPYQPEFGHGRALRLSVKGKYFQISIGIERLAKIERIETASAVSMEL